MSINIIDSLKALLSDALVNKAGSTLNETDSGIQKAMSAILPSVVSGLIHKSSTTHGAEVVSNLANQSYNSGVLNNLGSLFSSPNNSNVVNQGASWLSSLFGDKVSGLTNMISNFAGVKSSTSTSLLGMAVPAVLGWLGSHAHTNNLSANGLGSFLSSQKDNVAAAMPSGFSLSNLFSAHHHTDNTASHSVKTTTLSNDNNNGGGFGKYLPYLLLVLGLIALLWWWKGCKNSDETTPAVTTDTTHTVTMPAGKLDSTGEWIYDEGDTVTIKLPNNAGDLRVGKNSTEAKLVAFLQDPNAAIDTAKGNWFEFTNVHFKTGSSDLTEVSMTQLKNMVAIAKGFPKATFKFGGYTDNTGKHEVNLELSQKRAEAVAGMVKSLGAPEASMAGAKGYAEEWPISSNDTPEGRAMNRRVSVNVKSK